jgi:hypothetical protein
VESTGALLAADTAAPEPVASMAAVVAEVSTAAAVTDNETCPKLRARLLRLPGFSIARDLTQPRCLRRT